MGKTRYLCKKFGDIKGIFHAKIDTVKDGNHKDLTEAEEIKKWGRRWAGAGTDRRTVQKG